MLGAHESERMAFRWLRYAGILVLVLATMPRLAAAADQTLLLEVQVNGHSIGKVGEFTLRDRLNGVGEDELVDQGLLGRQLLGRDWGGKPKDCNQTNHCREPLHALNHGLLHSRSNPTKGISM